MNGQYYHANNQDPLHHILLKLVVGKVLKTMPLFKSPWLIKAKKEGPVIMALQAGGPLWCFSIGLSFTLELFGPWLSSIRIPHKRLILQAQIQTMDYNRIVAITGLPGLYEVLSSKSDGAIVRSLDDRSTKFVSSRIHNLSHLESIEVYTVKENVVLADIFSSLKNNPTPLPD
jgi:hypothetical protein